MKSLADAMPKCERCGKSAERLIGHFGQMLCYPCWIVERAKVTDGTPRWATMKQLLEQLENLAESVEDLPEAPRNAEHLLRIQVANHLAAARQCLKALAADEEAND